MNPATIIQQAKQDGVTLVLSSDGIRATGNNEAVARWLPVFRQQKPVLASALLESERQRIMQHMAGWNERAAMMTCGNTRPEQAEALAWRDLNLDEVFFGMRRIH